MCKELDFCTQAKTYVQITLYFPHIQRSFVKHFPILGIYFFSSDF